MKKKYLTFIFTAVIGLSLKAQNSTGINNKNPNTKAALDVGSIGKQGILIPRHGVSTIADTNSFLAAKKDVGLMFYDTLGAKFWYWTGNNWASFGKTSTFSTASLWSKNTTNRITTTDPNDYVGIGNLAPTKMLTVSNTLSLASSVDMGLIAGSSGTSTLFFGNTINNNLGAIQYSNQTNSFNFWTNNTSNRLVISNNGQIGIGIVPDVGDLHVHGNTSSEVHLTSSTIGTSGADGLRIIASSSNATINMYEAVPMYFGTGGAYRMAIGPTGNVGIGTGTFMPVNKLDVVGNTTIGANFAGIVIAPTNGLLVEGSVGIGAVPPTGIKMEVNGNLNVTGEIRRTETGDANMVPVAYGTISSTGTIYDGSTTNFTLVRQSAGLYKIDLDGQTYNFTTHVTVCSVYGSSLAYITYYDAGTSLYIRTYNAAGTPTDQYFNFVVYKK